MHTKLINPATDGLKVYHNLGPSDRLISYLLHESKENGKGEQIFFNQFADNISAETVRNALNGNVKGLRKNEEKFFTIVVSPGEDELRHIGNSDEKLKVFARRIMDDYAHHFNLKDGHQLEGKDLLWFAAIHADRKVKNLDLKKEDGFLSEKEKRLIQDLKAKGDPSSLKAIERIELSADRRNAHKLDEEVFQAGDNKPGLNKHIHIVVSRKDINMQYSLNPRGWKARFDLRKWQENNGHRFQELFSYTKETMHEAFYFPKQDKAYFEGKIEETIHLINEKYVGEEKLDGEQFKRIGAKFNYSRAFFINLGKLKSRYQKGDYFVDPYHFVARGRDIKPDEYAGQDKREGKGSWQWEGGKFTHKDPSFPERSFHFQELLAAFRHYRPFSYVRDPMLFEHELRRKRKWQQQREEGKQSELEN